MQNNVAGDGSEVGRALTQAGSIGRRLVAQQIDRQTTVIGQQFADVSASMKEAGEDVRKRGRATWLGDAFDYAAAYLERAGAYLTAASGDVLTRYFEAYARKRPVVVAGVALGSGFALARVLRVSALPG
jgi:hypothetical protein